MSELTVIRTVQDLRHWLGASGWTATHFSRRLYKDTACGASVSVLVGGQWYHNGDDTPLAPDAVLEQVLLSTIVEGSEAAFAVAMEPAATTAAYDGAIRALEEDAFEAWVNANDEEEAV